MVWPIHVFRASLYVGNIDFYVVTADAKGNTIVVRTLASLGSASPPPPPHHHYHH